VALAADASPVAGSLSGEEKSRISISFDELDVSTGICISSCCLGEEEPTGSLSISSSDFLDEEGPIDSLSKSSSDTPSGGAVGGAGVNHTRGRDC
jgi:hypothetical protein